MDLDEQLDLLTRVEILYSDLFVPFIRAIDRYYGEPEREESSSISTEFRPFEGLTEEDKERIDWLLKSRAENVKERLEKIYETAGVDQKSDHWLDERLWQTGFDLAEEIKNNKEGYLDSLRKIRWGLKLGLDLIPDDSYRKPIYHIIESLESEAGQKIRKMIDYYNKKSQFIE